MDRKFIDSEIAYLQVAKCLMRVIAPEGRRFTAIQFHRPEDLGLLKPPTPERLLSSVSTIRTNICFVSVASRNGILKQN